MDLLEKLEKKLIEVLDKKAPVRLSKEMRKRVADALWLLALVFGVMQLWMLFDRFALRMLDAPHLDADIALQLNFFYYLSLMVLTVAAVLLLVAAPALKAYRRDGWKLLFYAVLANAMYGVIRLFAGYGGFRAMIWVLLISAAAAYFVIQVRGQFTNSKRHDSEPSE